MSTRELTKEEQIAALTARYVIAAIMHRTRKAELEHWSHAALVRYYWNNTTMPSDGPFTFQQIKRFQRATLVEHITDYDVNVEDFQNDLYEQYNIAWDDLQPIINLYDVAVSKKGNRQQ